RQIKPKVVDWVFTEGEKKIAKKAANPNLAYLSLWAAKEAAAKSWGRALLNHLSQVKVVRADWLNSTALVDWQGNSPARATIEFVLHQDFLLALATKVCPWGHQSG
ncbi:MAG: 4'-phosphopantetheinyl transferase family protein, partial [Candidatus Adiutrix sp.]